jgi:hypothetical protein
LEVARGARHVPKIAGAKNIFKKRPNKKHSFFFGRAPPPPPTSKKLQVQKFLFKPEDFPTLLIISSNIA